MSEIDELPSWAGKALEDPATVPDTAPAPAPEDGNGNRRGLLFTVLGIAAILAIGLIALFVTRTDDRGVAADNETTDDAAADGAADGSGTEGAEGTDGDGAGTATEGAADEAASPTTAPSTTATSEAPSTTEATDATDDAGDADAPEDGANAEPVENADGSIRHAVFKGGQVFLRGRVPSEEVSQEIETKAGAVVGPDNVFNEYEIDPSVPPVLGAPLYVEDVVLFGFNSVRVETAFLPILDLGTLLLVQNPNVTIKVVTRTDAVGSEASNLRVSEQRAQAIINYWLGKGIDSSRLIADPPRRGRGLRGRRRGDRRPQPPGRVRHQRPPRIGRPPRTGRPPKRACPRGGQAALASAPWSMVMPPPRRPRRRIPGGGFRCPRPSTWPPP